jgi:hypothetical protein
MPNYDLVDPGTEQYGGTRAALANFLLGPDAPGTPRVLVLEMEPGFVIQRHSHGCERFEIIVGGSLYVGDDVLRAGDVMTARAGEFYGPKVAGPDGCVTAEVFAHQHASEPLYECADGTTSTSRPPDETAAQREWIEARRAEALALAAGS